MEEMGITDVTFNLIEYDVPNTMGIIKEIEPVYHAPENATGYRFFRMGKICVFIDRNIVITGPIVLKTEGFFGKKLALGGAKTPFFNF